MDFSQLSILLVVAAVFAFAAKLLRQPLLVGYLFAGVALSVSGLITDHFALENLGKIGVALLLFLLGLEMNIKEVATIGKHASIAGFFEMALTAVVGLGLALILGFPLVPALYIATALTFSSTIIMVKLLSEKKDLSSLYGNHPVSFMAHVGVALPGGHPCVYLVIQRQRDTLSTCIFPLDIRRAIGKTHPRLLGTGTVRNRSHTTSACESRLGIPLVVILHACLSHNLCHRQCHPRLLPDFHHPSHRDIHGDRP